MNVSSKSNCIFQDYKVSMSLTELYFSFLCLYMCFDTKYKKKWNVWIQIGPSNIFSCLCLNATSYSICLCCWSGQARKMHHSFQEINNDSPKISEAGNDSLSRKNQEQHIVTTSLKVKKIGYISICVMDFFFLWVAKQFILLSGLWRIFTFKEELR